MYSQTCFSDHQYRKTNILVSLKFEFSMKHVSLKNEFSLKHVSLKNEFSMKHVSLKNEFSMKHVSLKNEFSLKHVLKEYVHKDYLPIKTNFLISLGFS